MKYWIIVALLQDKNGKVYLSSVSERPHLNGRIFFSKERDKVIVFNDYDRALRAINKARLDLNPTSKLVEVDALTAEVLSFRPTRSKDWPPPAPKRIANQNRRLGLPDEAEAPISIRNRYGLPIKTRKRV